MRNKAVGLAVLLLLSGTAADLRPCTSVVIGCKASADGSVIFGHNEDDFGTRVVNAWRVPRLRHEPGESVRFRNGAEIPQVPETWAMIWFQVNGLEFSDTFCNEWGVTVASDACPSREDEPELTDGGIGFPLRRIVAERARTAREGVRIAGGLLDRFGYASSGRTLVICDPGEGWLLSIVAGKHWVAQRVPDDGVVVLPNTYVVRQVDPSDTVNFLVSGDDVIGHAVTRGWWPAGTGRPFDFAEAYRTRQDDSEAREKRNFDLRQWRGLSLLAGADIREEEAAGNGLPFFMKPGRPVRIQDVMDLMRDHFEGTRYDVTAGPGANPHFQGERPICHSATLFSVVARLRGDAPLPLRACLWVAFGRPDTTPFTPWYSGMTAVPDGFHNTPGILSPGDATARHFDPVPGTFDPDTSSAFWIFKGCADRVNADYSRRIAAASGTKRLIEERMFALEGEIEKQATLLDVGNPGKTGPYLARRAAEAAAWAEETLKAAFQGTPPDPGR